MVTIARATNLHRPPQTFPVYLSKAPVDQGGGIAMANGPVQRLSHQLEIRVKPRLYQVYTRDASASSNGSRNCRVLDERSAMAVAARTPPLRTLRSPHAK